MKLRSVEAAIRSTIRDFVEVTHEQLQREGSRQLRAANFTCHDRRRGDVRTQLRSISTFRDYARYSSFRVLLILCYNVNKRTQDKPRNAKYPESAAVASLDSLARQTSLESISRNAKMKRIIAERCIRVPRSLEIEI